MTGCYFLAVALVSAGIAICLGKKTTVTPKDCKNKSGAEIDTVHAIVKCGPNPLPDFMPRQCRIFTKENGYPTKAVKITLKAAGESSFWEREDARCQLTKDGGLRLFEGSPFKEVARAKLSVCSGRSEPGWNDNKDGYGFYCDQKETLYPPVIPVSCDFGRSVGIVDASGSRTGNTEGTGECFYNYKDASVTPNWSKSDPGRVVAAFLDSAPKH